MSVLGELQATVATQRRILSALEPGCFNGRDALAVLETFTAIERVGAAGRTLIARRVQESNVWRDSGERSAANFIANKTGTSVGKATSTLETAQRLEELPATAEAFRKGELSETQAEAVADAAARHPDQEHRLLQRAKGSLKHLRDECRRVKHAGEDEQERYDAIRRDRHLRTWTDADGAFCGAFRTTPDAGARMLAALDAEIDRVFKAARKESRREPRQAYAVDALESLVCAGAGGKRAKQTTEICVFVDHAAMLRGFAEAGEVCEIEGLGPVPMSVVKEWEADAYLRLIVTDGIDVKAISRRSRHIDRNQDAALRARDRSCIIEGCDVTWHLERDHQVPFAQGGPTSVDNLGRMCWWHHSLKSKGWRLTGGPGCYRLVPPGSADISRAPP